MKTSIGSITVICGPMYSGKTEKLLSVIRRAQCAKKKVQIFKHSLDDRYDKRCIISHTGDKIPSSLISNGSELLESVLSSTDLIALDEAQFFDLDIVNTLMEIRNQGYDIILSGLDLDFRGVPFGPMPYLLALADEIIKLKAVCAKTGKDAQYSQRLINGNPARHTDPIILVAASDTYQARSKDAFEIDYMPIREYLHQLKH